MGKMGDYYCERCKKKFDITDHWPRYKDGKELCPKCFHTPDKEETNKIVKTAIGDFK